MKFSFIAAIAAVSTLLGGCDHLIQQKVIFASPASAGQVAVIQQPEDDQTVSPSPSAPTQSVPRAEELPGQVVTPAPQVQAAPPATAEPSAFPTSRHTAVGKPWRTMHSEGFVGSQADACKLLDLSNVQCAEFARKADGCPVVDVHNGVVLDYLVFTEHKGTAKQKDVATKWTLVDLQNPSSWKARLCYLGHGVYVGRFYGCGNYFRINAEPPQPVKKPTPVAPPKAELPPPPIAVAPMPPPVAFVPAPPQPQACSIGVEVPSEYAGRALQVKAQFGGEIRSTASQPAQWRQGIEVPCDFARASWIQVCLDTDARTMSSEGLAVMRENLAHGRRMLNYGHPVRFHYLAMQPKMVLHTVPPPVIPQAMVERPVYVVLPPPQRVVVVPSQPVVYRLATPISGVLSAFVTHAPSHGRGHGGGTSWVIGATVPIY